jgi:hypothetical protein
MTPRRLVAGGFEATWLAWHFNPDSRLVDTPVAHKVLDGGRDEGSPKAMLALGRSRRNVNPDGRFAQADLEDSPVEGGGAVDRKPLRDEAPHRQPEVSLRQGVETT